MSFLRNQQLYTSPIRNQYSPVKYSQTQYAFQQDTPPQNLTQKKSLMNFQQKQPQLSPQKITEADLWKSRCGQLESSLCQINTDLELEKFKAKNAKELESRIDLVLKQNAQLLSENDQLNKNFQQKKTESDIWKNKYENQMNVIISLKANYELETKKMVQENLRLKQIADSINCEKFREVEDTKGRMFQEGNDKVEILKRSHSKNTSLYEEQIRKMKDIIEEREKEIFELQNRLNFTRNEAENEEQRVNEDRERLRIRIQQLEMDLQRELELQRNKQDIQFNDQFQAIKYLQIQEMETLESELRKLKKLIDQKNEEIQILINQNKNQKGNFDIENSDLKYEIQALKEKLYENNVKKDQEINELKEKLVILHTTDIFELKNRHENKENNLQLEIEKFKILLLQKAEELENQMREKNSQRLSYNQETDRLKGEIDNMRVRYSMLEKEKEKIAMEHANLIERTNQTHDNFTSQLKNQIAFLEQEIDQLKFSQIKKNNEIDDQNAKHITIKNTLEEDFRIMRDENDHWKKQFQAAEYQLNKTIEEQKHKFQIQEGNLQDRIRKLEGFNDLLQSDLNQAKECISLKSEEYHMLANQKQLDELEINKLKQEIDQLGDQIIYLEQLKAKELEEQRHKQEKQNEYQIQTLKISHQNNENILQDQINNLKAIIQQKEYQIDDMISKYNLLENSFSEFQANADKLQDYEKRIQLLGAEIVTTKNLYDVFVRTKSRFVKK